MTYNTGNLVPSKDPRDLDDNAEAFDRFLQSTAASEPDRLGQLRKTWHQMELDAAALVSPNVSALAAAVAAANKAVYFSSAGPVAMSTYDLSAFVRGVSGSADDAAFRTGITAAKSGVNADITSITGLTTMLPVNQGGTGGNDQASARSGIAAAKSGANTDITSIGGLTTALSIAQGGTGATTAAAALSALGAQTAWVNLPLSNSWTVIGSRRAVYRKVLGMLQVQCEIVGGTATDGTVVATLPAGFRVIFETSLNCVSPPGTSLTAGVTLPRVVIKTDGTITCQNVNTGGAIAFNAFLPLD